MNNVFNEEVIRNKYKLLALNRFKWEGLPPSIKQEYIEKALYHHGQVAFFFNEERNEFLVLPCTEQGEKNIYHESIIYQVNGYNFQKLISIQDMVRIRNNELNYPTHAVIEYYVDKIKRLDSLEDTNIEQQKVPYLITTTKDNELQVINFLKKVKEGQPAILIDQTLKDSIGGKDGVSAFSLNVPYLLDKIPEYRKILERELLTYLGINSADTDKRERMIVDEVNANNEEIMASIDTDLRLRKKACEEINKMFNLNVSVEINKTEVKGGLCEHDNNRTE